MYSYVSRLGEWEREEERRKRGLLLRFARFFLKKTNLEKLVVKLKCARTSHEKSGKKIERSSQIWEVAIGAFFLFSDIVKEREKKRKTSGCIFNSGLRAR